MKKYLAVCFSIIIKLEMQDANDDQATQNNQADVMFVCAKDVVLINPCDANSVSYIKDLAVKSGVPVLFYN